MNILYYIIIYFFIAGFTFFYLYLYKDKIFSGIDIKLPFIINHLLTLSILWPLFALATIICYIYFNYFRQSNGEWGIWDDKFFYTEVHGKIYKRGF